VVIRDRKHLSEAHRSADYCDRQAHGENGIASGNREPRIDERQRTGTDRRRALVIMKTVEESNAEEKSDWRRHQEKIRVDLKRYINKQTSKRPLILPVILEV